MGLYDFTFYDLIHRNASCFADKAAWIEADDQQAATFSEYKKMVDRLAQGLKMAGINKGDRIGVLGKNSLEYFLLYGAAAAVGAIILPINWRLSADEVCFNLNDCEPKSLFVDIDYQELVRGIKDKLPSVKQHINLKADEGNFDSFNALMDNSGESLEGEVSVSQLLTTIRDCCSREAGFITGEVPVLESIFRIFLANGNQPLELAVLSQHLSKLRGGDPYRTSVKVLSRLLYSDHYYGFRKVPG